MSPTVYTAPVVPVELNMFLEHSGLCFYKCRIAVWLLNVWAFLRVIHVWRCDVAHAMIYNLSNEGCSSHLSPLTIASDSLSFSEVTSVCQCCYISV